MRDAAPEHVGVWGWLLVLAWAAAVRNNQEDEARECLRAAASAGAASAQSTVRCDRDWSTLGTATVAMKEVEHEVITGNYPRRSSLPSESRQGG